MKDEPAPPFEPGDRVGVMYNFTKGIIRLLGYGTFEGYTLPAEGTIYEGEDLHKSKTPVTVLKLDDGREFYGCFAWWDREEAIQEFCEKSVEGGVKLMQIDDSHAEIQARMQASIKSEETFSKWFHGKQTNSGLCDSMVELSKKIAEEVSDDSEQAKEKLVDLIGLALAMYVSHSR